MHDTVREWRLTGRADNFIGFMTESLSSTQTVLCRIISIQNTVREWIRGAEQFVVHKRN